MSTLLYLSAWDLSEGLTQAVVFPDLEILRESKRFDRIVFVSAEQDTAGSFAPPFATTRILHLPMFRRHTRPRLVARALEFLSWPRRIAELCRRYDVGTIFARGTQAGALVHLSQGYAVTPYLVASFEPHAQYMLESGAWQRWDPRYAFQTHWERAQKGEARALLPVSEAYRDQLLAEGVSPSRVITLPSTVDAERFRFSSALRQAVRTQLALPSTSVLGIYVGKFGDNYYDVEAFEIFARFLQRLRNFWMLVLTPMSDRIVHELARRASFSAARLIVRTMPHAEVPPYLCAADVAFATVRPTPSRRFCSPVKTGEYWACGLPTVITEGVGDDSRIIDEQAAGAVVTLASASIDAGAERIEWLLRDGGHRERIAMLARRFRPRSRIREAFTEAGLF